MDRLSRNVEVASEVGRVSLGDHRLNSRLGTILGDMCQDPAASFPRMFKDGAALEGAYRFFRNERVCWSKILDSHRLSSYERMDQQEEVVVIHDTTGFEFENNSPRAGLGRLQGQGIGHQGFFGHFSLAASAGSKLPLGVIGAKFYSRSGKPKRENKRNRRVPNGPHNESYRWVEQALRVQRECRNPEKLIHVMDREADSFEVFEALLGENARLVIRIHQNRTLSEGYGGGKLFDEIAAAPVTARREIKLSRRYRSKLPKGRKHHPARPPSETTLLISATRVTLRRSRDLKLDGPEYLDMNVVHVWEEDPVNKDAPVDWKLITTEPIDTPKQIEKIVDYYRTRWLIEEYFKALKTGCAFERRQQESLKALLNVLALFLPVAWWLLCLRKAASQDGPTDVLTFTTPLQRRILEARFPDLKGKLNDPQQVLMAVARLGGHIKHNGPPGWLVLYRGHDTLLKMELGYLLASIHRDK